MPSMMTSDADMETHSLGGNFNFTGTRIESLGATSYTLVSIGVDETSSMSGFERATMEALTSAIEACSKSPRVDNLLLRVFKFSSSFAQGTSEIHGFKPLPEIDPKGYQLRPHGSTPLYDACYSGIGAANAYAEQLNKQDFLVNAITFIITDGGENASTATRAMVKAEIERAVRSEALESHVSILIGIDTGGAAPGTLQSFKDEAGLTQFINAGEATKQKLAQLAQFVSRSISSTSQALGTGGPSQTIQAVI